MSEPLVIPPGGGEIIGDAPDRRVEILCDHDALHATWSRFARGRDGADLHVHHRHTDLFYVLDGELSLRLGTDGETVAVPAGTLARIPPGVVHGFRNASDADVRYLNLHAPGREFATFMRALRDGIAPPADYDQHPPPADGGRPTTEAVVGDESVLSDAAGMRVTLHAEVDAIRVAEVRCEPATGPMTHAAHPGHGQSLYVLAGVLALTPDGGRALRAEAGSWLRLAPGTSCTAACSGAEAVRYLDLRTPERPVSG
jgi:quercetin dioxygenase-like cupin family protein